MTEARVENEGDGAEDVRCALLVLSKAQDLPQFANLPNVHVEGEMYHFLGLR